MVYVNLIALSAVIAYITEVSGIIDTLKYALGRWLGVTVSRLKPLDCSLCMTWWCGLIYIICVGECSVINIAFVALLSALAHNIAEGIMLISDSISLGIDKIRDRLWK